MKKFFQNLTALLAVTLVSFSAFAEEKDVKQTLEAMAKAVDSLNYEIAFVQTRPTNMGTFRFRHIKQDNKTFAQLVTLDGIQREIIQRDNLVSYFQINERAFTIQSSDIVDQLPAVMRADFESLSANYDFIPMEKNRIAGRIVDTIRIVPKDDFRYQYQVFIDEENHLLLRSDLLDREGNLLDQFRVVTIYIDNELKGLIDYLTKVALPPLLDDGKQKRKTLDFDWQANWMPDGFKLIRQTQENTEYGDVIEAALFSDGLFTFNIYVSSSDVNADTDTPWRQDDLTIYSKTVGNKEITVIGQLPITTAKRIVQEVSFK